MDLFATMRWNNAGWYTANPLETMTDEQLARLAGQVGMTLGDCAATWSRPTLRRPARCAGSRRRT